MSHEELNEMLIKMAIIAVDRHKELNPVEHKSKWMKISDAAIYLNIPEGNMRDAISKADPKNQLGLNPIIWYSSSDRGPMRVHVDRYQKWTQYKDQPNFHKKWLAGWLKEDTPGSKK